MSSSAVFLCYPTRANRSPGQGPDMEGPISRLREALVEEVRIQSGDPDFDIFMDRTHVEVSENWQRRINEGLDQATLLLVLIQPLLFASSWCREEIDSFLKAEAKAGRDDLIIPVLYVTTPELDIHSTDKLAQKLAERQYFDWRPYRLTTLDAPQTMRAVGALAEKITKALRRSKVKGGVTPPTATVFTNLRPVPSKQAEEELYRFLIAAFSVDEFGRLLRYELPEVAAELPGGPVSPAQFFSNAVEALRRHDALDGRFFDKLASERPRRAGEVQGLRGMFKV